ncbi:hypothetical protein O6H91_03G115700 [Diphasiastrum complanatum]|uniref:Uncharacterized protein n=2 Tax=Diphasiastrum complanatum TaxID=34168 RepID=A0ACC2EAU9_DIPCM|nr:hypothetical protein O6H91_03G115700 [Diphasiastrum complanatum]KAJ7563577.1 hypothetical protein O6H91_03G115700 [Diphasiastrum complanatum]
MGSKQVECLRRRHSKRLLQSSKQFVEPNVLSLVPARRRSIGRPVLRQLGSECLTVIADHQLSGTTNISTPKNDSYVSRSYNGPQVWSRREFQVAQGLKRIRESNLVSSLGPQWLSKFSTLSKTERLPKQPSATAIFPPPQQKRAEGEHANLSKHATSPEDCDQAVEVLSSAKAEAKLSQEAQKMVTEPLIRRSWNILLGIGPALRAVASMSRQDWAVKVTEWKKIFLDELKHYWMGTKLLWANVSISSRLLMKLANGRSLTRRERQQLTRTAADIFRLVPFAVIVIVPFMELLLPVLLKLFPNMLPSTFQDKMKEEEALKKKLNARLQYAKFLQDTVAEMAKEIKATRTGDIQRTAEDLDRFMNKVRTGGKVNNEEILGFAKLFNDELTLDNISRPRLVSMCKYMGIQTYGTDAYLRYCLRERLAWIKEDDKLISSEGVESLLESELRAACRERGMLGLVSIEEMKQQLQDWLDLSLNHSVPSSLLILSRSFVSGKLKPEEAVQATLSSLPDEVVESVGVTVLPSEDTVEERKRKLEYLRQQEELIKVEAKEEEEQQKRIKKEEASVALDQVPSVGTRKTTEADLSKKKNEQDRLYNLSNALAVLASASSVSTERAEFLALVNKEIEMYKNMIAKKDTADAEEARKAYVAAREDSDHAAEAASSGRIPKSLIAQVDKLLHKLEKELDEVDSKISDRWKILDLDCDGKVTPEEVAAAATYLKKTVSDEPVQELINKLTKDEDGKILVEDIVRLTVQGQQQTTKDKEALHSP